MKKVVVFLIMVFLISCFAEQKASGQNVRIKYGFGGKFGPSHIADTASAYYTNGKLIAMAWVLKIIKQSGSPNHILVNEKQYDLTTGNAIYEGTIEFEIGSGGGTVIKETVISGVKKYDVFRSWRCGT